MLPVKLHVPPLPLRGVCTRADATPPASENNPTRRIARRSACRTYRSIAKSFLLKNIIMILKATQRSWVVFKDTDSIVNFLFGRFLAPTRFFVQVYHYKYMQ